MRIVRLFLLPALASFWVLASARAAPTIIYDNIAATSSGFDAVASFGPLYDSFSTGSAATPGALITTPGALITTVGTVLDSNLLTSPQPITVSLTAMPTLSASTRYWIGLSATGSASWLWSSDTSGTGVAGEFFSNSNGTFPNAGAPYQMQVTVGSGTDTLSGLQLLLDAADPADGGTVSVGLYADSTAVPEPASMAMLGVSLIGLGAARRRKPR